MKIFPYCHTKDPDNMGSCTGCGATHPASSIPQSYTPPQTYPPPEPRGTAVPRPLLRSPLFLLFMILFSLSCLLRSFTNRIDRMRPSYIMVGILLLLGFFRPDRMSDPPACFSLVRWFTGK